MTTGRGRSIGELIARGRALDLVRVLPAARTRRGEQLWERDPRPGALPPHLRLGDLRRRWQRPATRPSQITGRIARETSLLPMAHLTCVGHTREELERDPRLATPPAGVHHVMALRGDPEEGPRADWMPTDGRSRPRRRAGRAGRRARRVPDRGGGLPRGAPLLGLAGPRRRRAGGQGPARGRVRGHPDVLPRRRLLRPRRAGARRGGGHADPPRDHADPEPAAPSARGRAHRRRRARARSCSGSARTTATRPRCAPRASRWPPSCAEELLAGGAPGPALLHAQPVEGDARDLRGTARSTV